MNSQLIQLAEVLSASTRQPDHLISYTGKTLRFKYVVADEKKLRDSLATFFITPEFYPGNECEVEIYKKYKDNTVIFFDRADYIKRTEVFKDEFDAANFIILSFDGAYAVKESFEPFSPAKALFFNVPGYQALIDFFATNTDFISLHDKILHQLVIFSGDKGPFYLGYNKLDDRIKNLPDLKIELEKLREIFLRIDFVQFFKEAVINGIHKEAVEDRFFVMIQSLQVLLELAVRDHRIYLKKFGFDKIKARFKEERIKYFDSIEKNIEAVSKQVTSFPLTFAASAFAAYQVKEAPAVLILILVAYGMYTMVAWEILNMVSFNTRSISADAESESKKIENDYGVLFEEFNPDFQKIRDKIGRLKKLIRLLRRVLIGLLIAFALFFVYETFYMSKAPAAPKGIQIVK